MRLQRCACGGGCPRCRAAAAQPALAVNTPGDAHEREADRIADAVVSGAPASTSIRGPAGALQRCACGGSCPACRAKQDGEEELRREDVGGSATPGFAPPVVHDVLSSPGQALEPRTRGVMESRIGADFGGVRVHTGELAAASARAVDAHAYTVGRDVVFGAGAYQPGTARGDRLIAHELAHVVQQRGGVARVQRACGEAAIGAVPPGCYPITATPAGRRFLFNRGCDEWAPGAEAGLRIYVTGLPATATVDILGIASSDGPNGFNQALSCRRAEAAERVIRGAGRGASIRTVRAGGPVGAAGDVTNRAADIVVRSAPSPPPPPPPTPTPTPSPPPPTTVPSNVTTVDCTPSNVTELAAAVPLAAPMVRKALRVLRGPSDPAVDALLRTYFNDASASTYLHVILGLDTILTGITGSYTLECEQPGSFMYNHFCGGANAYVRSVPWANVHLCGPAFGRSPVALAETVIHECSHKFDGTDDHTTCWSGCPSTLSRWDAYDNADSFSKFARDAYTTLP